ncbi:MAG: RNB domain-containing ribonuclease [Gammaproteobacteria bacterium]|nr:RNB domain-containing ribonuclease [Gammaproteobacteria bacterium]
MNSKVSLDGADVLNIAVRHGISQMYPDAVHAEAAQWAQREVTADPALIDRRSMPFVTIDNEDSRDLDQAVYVSRPSGEPRQYMVHYALADAAHFVSPASALFHEALARGASYYLPGVSLPMLPRVLCEDLISLNPEVERRAMLMSIRLDDDGEVIETHFERAKIRSRAKLSYAGVQRFYDGATDHSFSADVAHSLALLAEIGGRRMIRAEERDIVRYRRAELVIKSGHSSGLFSVLTRPRFDSEKYNEQMSLLANIEGARRLLAASQAGHRTQPIFRVHPNPGSERLEGFAALLDAMADARGLSEAHWRWRPGGSTSLADFLAALPEDAEAGAISKALHRQALMLNFRSTYSTDPGAHYGVGAAVYGRFSAPMREVVGVFTHKELWEALAPNESSTQPLPASIAADESTRERVVEQANAAKQRQAQMTREANKVILDQLMGDDFRLGNRRSGTVVGLSKNKLHVSLDSPPIDVKVYYSHLGDSVRADRDFVHVRSTSTNTNICTLGDRVELCVLGEEGSGTRHRWRLDLRRLG